MSYRMELSMKVGEDLIINVESFPKGEITVRLGSNSIDGVDHVTFCMNTEEARILRSLVETLIDHRLEECDQGE